MSVHAELAPGPYPAYLFRQAPRNVYWEMTTACDLACRHCRANAIPERDEAELTTEEGKALMREVARMGSLLILTGGDPMKREDLFELIAYAREIRLPLAITPSATPSLQRGVMRRFRELGVAALGLSLDGPTAQIHDAFRGVPGTYLASLRALQWAREAGLPVQINTTVTRDTIPHLKDLYRLLSEEAHPPVVRWSLFFLVPVGRGASLGVPTAPEIEALCQWIYLTAADSPFHISTVEAPHYRRVWLQQRRAGEVSEALAKRMGFGIRDGNGVVFVSHRGDVFPAGFLPEPVLGNVRQRSLGEIYRTSAALEALRDADAYTGKCGRCEFRWVCGGSRARALSMTGDRMGSDPFCVYEPPEQREQTSHLGSIGPG